MKKDGAVSLSSVSEFQQEEDRKGHTGFEDLGITSNTNKRKSSGLTSGVTMDWSMNEMREVGDSFCRRTFWRQRGVSGVPGAFFKDWKMLEHVCQLMECFTKEGEHNWRRSRF